MSQKFYTIVISQDFLDDKGQDVIKKVSEDFFNQDDDDIAEEFRRMAKETELETNSFSEEDYFEILEEAGQKNLDNQNKKSFIEETDDFVYNAIKNLNN